MGSARPASWIVRAAFVVLVSGALLSGCSSDGSDAEAAGPSKIPDVEAAIRSTGQTCNEKPKAPSRETEDDFADQGLTAPSSQLSCGAFQIFEFPNTEARDAHAEMLTALTCSIGGSPVARVTYLAGDRWDVLHPKAVETVASGRPAEAVATLTAVGKELGVEPKTVECVTPS